MMFMMPTPPIASVSTPMNVSTTFSPRDDAADDLLRLCGTEHVRGAFVGRVVAIAAGEVLAHLFLGFRVCGADTERHTTMPTCLVSISPLAVVHGMKMQYLSGRL